MRRILCHLGIHTWGPSADVTLIQCEHCGKLARRV